MIWWQRQMARRAARDAVVRAARLAVAQASFGDGHELVWDQRDLVELACKVRIFERLDRHR